MNYPNKVFLTNRRSYRNLLKQKWNSKQSIILFNMKFNKLASTKLCYTYTWLKQLKSNGNNDNLPSLELFLCSTLLGHTKNLSQLQEFLSHPSYQYTSEVQQRPLAWKSHQHFKIQKTELVNNNILFNIHEKWRENNHNVFTLISLLSYNPQPWKTKCQANATSLLNFITHNSVEVKYIAFINQNWKDMNRQVIPH